MKRMKRLSWQMMFAAVLLAGVLTVPAFAQYGGVDVVSSNAGAWVESDDIMSTRPIEYSAVAAPRNHVTPYDIIFVAGAGGNVERWEDSAGWVRNPGGGIVSDGAVYNDLTCHVGSEVQFFGCNETDGGVDFMGYTTSWTHFYIFGAGTNYNCIGMEEQPASTILYVAPAGGDMQRWTYTTSWAQVPGSDIDCGGAIYNDVVGDHNMSDSMWAVPQDGGIDRIRYNGISWAKEDNVPSAAETYVTIAASSNGVPANYVVLYAGLEGGGIDRWVYNTVSWSSERISNDRYNGMSCHAQNANYLYAAEGPPVQYGTTVAIK